MIAASQRQTDEKFSMIDSWIWLIQPTSREFLSSTNAAHHCLHFYITKLSVSFDVNYIVRKMQLHSPTKNRCT